MTGRTGQFDLEGVALSRAAQLRAAADGELSPSQRSELDGSLTEAELRAIEAETALRGAVGRLMAEPVAPAGLRERILGAAAAAHDGPDAPAPEAEDRGPIPMAPWLRPLALAAAVVLLAAGGWLILRSAGNSVTGPTPNEGRVQLVELRQFMSREHDRCFQSDDYGAQKFTADDLAAVPHVFRPLLGSEVSVAELVQAGLSLRGAGRCHLPGPGNSIHMLLDAPLPTGTVTLSLFVQEDAGNTLGFEQGVAYELTPNDGQPAKLKIIAWRSGDLDYYLVADPEACDRIREAMGRGGPCGEL
ncbi:MAG: hypothetical protein ACF8R7_00385 [Phycisphaerales bacterium JB039]